MPHDLIITDNGMITHQFLIHNIDLVILDIHPEAELFHHLINSKGLTSSGGKVKDQLIATLHIRTMYPKDPEELLQTTNMPSSFANYTK